MYILIYIRSLLITRNSTHPSAIPLPLLLPRPPSRAHSLPLTSRSLPEAAGGLGKNNGRWRRLSSCQITQRFVDLRHDDTQCLPPPALCNVYLEAAEPRGAACSKGFDVFFLFGGSSSCLLRMCVVRKGASSWAGIGGEVSDI